MAKRESRMNEVRLYSDNLDSDLSKASNTIKSYKKVETTTTTKTVVKSGSKPSRTTVTQKRSTIVGDLGIPRQSKEFLQPPKIKEILAAKEGPKEKYAYSGKVKEKENYLYYVSGIGYVTKDGLPAKDNKPKEIKATKTQPKPARVVGERVTIVIQNKKKEREGGDLVENFQYYESKDIDKNNKESIVVHKRKGDPFYQNIHGKRNSSYTQGIRSRATLEKNEIQSKRIETSTITQTNQYQNKTYNTTKVTKTTTGRGSRNNNESSYQRTINVQENRKIIPKTRFEKTYTETNRRTTTSVEQNKNAAAQKQYQDKTKETNRRQVESQINQRTLDAAKNKRNAEQNKYQQKTEETQQTRISQEQNMINDPNYCPIHGYHGHGQANYDEIENYKFHESKELSRKSQNLNNKVNTNININKQHIVNTEENMNSNYANINAMNQEQIIQGEEGYDMSKLYIATKVIPVYSEMLDQQFQSHTHVCRVCGNPFGDQMDMMQQNQINSMQEMEYDINCPIHGQNASQ